VTDGPWADGLPDRDDGRHPEADASLAAVVVPLLKGVLYREDDVKAWDALTRLQAQVRDYVAILQLELMIDEAEGYAFLRSRRELDNDAGLPRLVARRRLSFPVSLLLALLRKRFVELDASGADSRLIVTRDEAAEMMRLFLPSGSNEAKMADAAETHLNKVVELGFARKLRSRSGNGERAYEVRRILKSFVDAEWLAEFDERLAEYHRHASGSDGADESAVAGEPGAADEPDPDPGARDDLDDEDGARP